MIVAIILLVFAVVGLALIIFKVPISQTAINIILLLSIIIIAVERLNWIR